MKSFLLTFSGVTAFGVLVGIAMAEDIPARIDAGHAVVAAAPKKAPEYVPIVVDRAQYDLALSHLNKQPFEFSLPLVRWLNELEDRAKRQWEADNNPKAEPAK